MDLIVTSAFCNPQRAKYKTFQFFPQGPEFKILETDSSILSLIKEWCVRCMFFDFAPGVGRTEDSVLREKLYNHRLSADEPTFIDVETEKWSQSIKGLNWYGPFVSESSKDYFFKTWDENGSAWGFTVYQRYNPDEIWVSWNDQETGKVAFTIVVQKSGETKLSSSPFEQPSESSKLQDSSDIIKMLKRFNFGKKSTTFHLDSIGRACFANPLRTKYEVVEFQKEGEKFTLCPGLVEADDFGMIICKFKGLEQGWRKLNEHQISIYDVSRLSPEVQVEEWKEGLKSLRWYGPFKNAQDSQFFFRTFSDSGECFGFIFHFDTEANKFRIHFRDKFNRECGESYEF